MFASTSIMQEGMDSLYIVVPAYNEEINIKKFVEQWYPILDGKTDTSKLIIADSGSTDRTHDILTVLQKKYPKLDILTGTSKGHGPKLMALYDYAIKNGADYIFQTDSDLQTNSEEFEAFWQRRKQYDGIFGNRVVRGDGFGRAFVEKVVCYLLKLYFGVVVPDANAPFRLLKCDILKKYLYMIPSGYDLPNIMITAYYAYYGEKMEFQEISFKERSGGVNSINIIKIVKIGWKALNDFYKFKKEMRKAEERR